MSYTSSDAALINGGIQSIGAAYMGSMQSTWNMKNTKKLMALEQEYNEKNMELQDMYNQKYIDDARAYNDPAAVAQRYRASGVSPQAAMNGAASGAGVQSSVPGSPDSASIGAGGKTMPMNITEGAMTQMAQYNRLVAETDNIRADTQLKTSQSGNTDEDTVSKSMQNSLFGYIREATAANARSAVSDAERKEVEVSLSKIEVLCKNKEYERAKHEIDNLIKDGKLKEATYLNLQKMGILIDNQIETEKSKKRNLDTGSDKNVAETETINESRSAVVSELESRAKSLISDSKLSESKRVDLLYSLYSRIKQVPDVNSINSANLSLWITKVSDLNEAEFDRFLDAVNKGEYDSSFFFRGVDSKSNSERWKPKESFEDWKKRRGYK